jgi:hypothetical protein
MRKNTVGEGIFPDGDVFITQREIFLEVERLHHEQWQHRSGAPITPEFWRGCYDSTTDGDSLASRSSDDSVHTLSAIEAGCGLPNGEPAFIIQRNTFLEALRIQHQQKPLCDAAARLPEVLHCGIDFVTDEPLTGLHFPEPCEDSGESEVDEQGQKQVSIASSQQKRPRQRPDRSQRQRYRKLVNTLMC